MLDNITPTTGVINNRHLPYLYEEEYIDLNYEYRKSQPDFNEDIEYLVDDSDSSKLYGFIESNNKEECWYWFDDPEGGQGHGFKPDPEEDMSIIESEIYAQIVRSKWFTECDYCSPCFPNQGDLDTEGSLLTYAPDPDSLCEEDEYSLRLKKRIKEIGK